MDHPDLEVSLFRQEAGVYAVDLRLADPGSEADRRLNGTAPIRFDYEALRKASQDPAAYGTLLAGTLLAEEAVSSFFAEAIATAEANDAPLAVRLAINPNAVELHSLRWETLQLPNSSAPLLTGENLRFSRYLSSLDWRPVRLRPHANLCALVAVVSPSNPAKWQLAEVKTADELAAVRAGLGSIAVTELATRGQVTLNNLAAHLSDGCDAELSGLRGQLDLVCGRPSAALATAKRAVASARNLEQVHEEGRFLRILAGAQVANRQSKQAEKSFKQSLDSLAEHDPCKAACTKLAWGRLLISAGNKEKGETLMKEATATFLKLGAQRELAGLPVND